MSLVSALVALALILAFGGLPWRWDGERTRSEVLVRAFLAGALALHLSLELLDAVGLRWSIAPLLACAAVVQLAVARLRSKTGSYAPAAGPTYGDAVAATACGAFAVFALRLQAVTPDFVYHWGLKARRFAELGEIDLDFLSLPSAFRFQPQYPCLAIDLAALPGTLSGGDSIAAGLVPSLAAFVLMPVIARDLLARTGAGGFVRGSLLAIWTLVIARFALGHRMAGQADLLLAFAVLAALPALLDPARPHATREIALSAAFAAVAKTEGLAYAALIVGIHAASSGALTLRSPEPLGRRVRRLALPVAAVALAVAPWLARNARLDLGDGGLTGGYRWERTAAAVVEITRWFGSSPAPEWSLWPILALAAIPFLLVRARTRAVGALALGIFAVHLTAFSGGSPNVGRWVSLSFPRLLFHWVPAVLLAVAVESAGVAAGGAADRTVPGGTPRASTGRRIRRALPVLVALAASAWAASGFVRGVEQVRHLRERFTREAPADRAGIRSPWSFRPYTPEVVALGELLGAPGERIPARSTVVVAVSPESDRTLSDRLWSWAHVHRADLDFVRPGPERRRDRASYWLALGAAPSPPSGEPIASGRAGRLYRLEPGAAPLPDGGGPR
jgi:hypothetical protein